MMNRLGIKGALAASIALACSLGAAAHASDNDGFAAAAPNVNVSPLKIGGSYDRFIVRYRDGSSEQASPALALQGIQAAVGKAAALRASLSLSQPSVNYRRQLATGSHLVTTSRKLSEAEAADFMRSIAADPAVAYVQPDVLRQAVDIVAPTAYTPNDTYFARYQTDYLAADGKATPGSAVANWGGSNVSAAWDLADGTGITIAVIDTGIVKHADVDTSLGDAGYDFIVDHLVSGRSSDGRVAGGWDLGDWTTGSAYTVANGGCVDASNPARNSSWHGTHVASASGAELTGNSTGMAGIAYKAKVVPIRALGHCGGYDSDINDAIVWAAGGHVNGVPDNTNPAQVINLSLGGEGACKAEDDAAIAIAKANALGAAVVVAAGNSGDDVALYSPASCPGAITVASTGVGSRLSYYSNYNAPGESIVALAAFGGGVYANEASSGTQLSPEGFAWQAVNKSLTSPTASPGGDSYGGMAGTSQATPHVTGAVALMQSARLAAGLPKLTPAQVASVLKATAVAPHVAPDPARTFGAGLLDAAAAVTAAAKFGTDVTALTNGSAVTGQSGTAGSSKVYKLDVPAGALALTLRTLGGSGNVSLYVKVGAAATASSYDYKSVNAGNAESVAVSRPVAGTYYVTVVGETDYAGVTVLGNYTAPKN